MICRKCGTEFAEGIFCPECGTKNEDMVNDEKLIVEEIGEEGKNVEEKSVKDKQTVEIEKTIIKENAEKEEREIAEQVAQEEARKLIESEKDLIMSRVEKEERERAIQIAQEEARKNISSEDADIKKEASNRIREEAIQKAKQDEERRIQEEEALKLKKEKIINRKAILSLVLSILSWIGILTVIIPVVGGIWSIVDGVKALKGRTKYKKCAIIGITLSVLVLGFIVYACVFAPSYDDNSSTAVEDLSDTNAKQVTAEIVDEGNTIDKENSMDTANEEDIDNLDMDKTIETEDIQFADENADNADIDKPIDTEDIQFVEENTDNLSIDESIETEEIQFVEENQEEGEAIYIVDINIDYKKPAFSYNDDAIVYVDDIEIGTIKAGKSEYYTIETTEGDHRIWVESDTVLRNNNSAKVKFYIDDKNTIFDFSLKDGSFAGLKLSKK